MLSTRGEMAEKNEMRDSVSLQVRARRRSAVRAVSNGNPVAAPETESSEPLVGFGPHLVFDGYSCPPERIADVARVYQLLDHLPDRIGMTKIMPPYVFRHGASGAPGEGVSGFVLIAESHISVHTFLDRRFVNVDIFSCEKFDVEDAMSALKQEFAPRRVDWKLFDRGLEFPRHRARSRSIVARERRSVARTLGLEASS
jgi:S-adenosylmethionine decarboxylase